MKATVRYNAGNGMWIEVEAESPKAALKEMAAYIEVFAEQACGCCGSKAIFWEHRQVDGNDYYSVRCRQCRAELNLGQTKVGDRLYAKRKDHPETNGWHQWQKRGNEAPFD